MAEAFLQYCVSNSIVIPLSANSIRDFCREASEPLNAFDLHYLTIGNASFGTVNMIKPGTFNGTAFGGLVWSGNSVTGNGTNAYITTNFNPALLPVGQKYQLNNACFGGVVRADGTVGGDPAGNSVFAGSSTITENLLLILNHEAQRINAAGNSLPLQANMAGAGFKAISRPSGSSVDLFNKSVKTSYASVSVNIPNDSQAVLRRAVANYSKHGVQSYFAGASLTDAQVLTYRTAFNKMLAANGLAQTA